MTQKKIRYVLSFILLGVVAILGAPDVFAGPPLLCHPLEIGDARSLPWNGAEWRDVKLDYEADRLVGDTLDMLQPEAPIIVRMETLRRATVYAVWTLHDHKVKYPIKDLAVANKLLAELTARAEAVRGRGGVTEALALFDLGYLAEAYREASHSSRNPAADIDGYATVTRAIKLRGREPAMEFAAALMTLDSRRAGHAEHLRKAYEGAPNDALLARNLAKRFDNNARAALNKS
ncbi:MAG TPA: hypothetical protein VM870_10860 [Pyrinomonadaceae bacterium]|jgi:hypothetical protein|nr:hypothetical protein [Pyrinomonadaceae bacterium]